MNKQNIEYTKCDSCKEEKEIVAEIWNTNNTKTFLCQDCYDIDIDKKEVSK